MSIFDVQFEPESHRYSINGQTLPSVTQVLEPFQDFDGIPATTLDRARDKGRDVHKAIELLEADELDPDSVDDMIGPYLGAWQRWKAESGAEVLICEGLVYHDAERYAGMIDLLVKIGPGIWLLDVKTTAATSRVWPLQTCAYLTAARREGVIGTALRDGTIGMGCVPQNARRGVLHLRPHASRLLEHPENPEDWLIFKSALNIKRWRMKA